jgi:DNA sulfur modification protein DndD
MIFENLLINNFGVYSGKQNFDLSTKEKKPVILIGALNGSGKTTFLQAIDFVLYGKFSNFFYSQKLSYENFLKKNINKNNYDEGAQVELVFFRKYKGKNEKFKISRNWKAIGKKIKEEFFVFIDDVYDEDITKDWDNFVDQILPSRVASLFFFDGEKIEQLADLEQSKGVLKKAINSLLGLEIVDQLNIDVDEFQKRSVLQLKTNEEKKNINKLKKEVDGFEDRIKEIDESIVKVEDELAKKAYDIRELNVVLSQKGISYYEKKQEYEKELQVIDEKRSEISDELVKLASGDLPLLVVKKELAAMVDQSKSLLENQNKTDSQKKNNDLIESISSFVLKNSKDDKFTKNFEKFVSDKKINDTTILDNENLLPNLNYQDLNSLLNHNLDTAEKDIKKKINTINKLEEEYEKISQLINKIPTDDEIKPLIDKLEGHQKDEAKLVTKKNILDEQRGHINGPLIKINIELKKEYEKKTTQDLVNLDKKRFVDYSVRIKDVLSTFHVKALDFHIKRLEKLILECFKSLHRKKDFIKSIKIDTSTFDLQVFEAKNVQVDTDILSAGERQLLAVAILWGLAKASNSAAPTVIDTPLGRLDSEHRLNLVEQYFPTASKQVILLSTDEEINQKYHKYMKPYLARSYKIEYDEKINGSKSTLGYFF